MRIIHECDNCGESHALRCAETFAGGEYLCDDCRKMLPDCPTCGDEGVVWFDAVDRRNEHVTRSEPCPDCCEAARDDADDPEDRMRP